MSDREARILAGDIGGTYARLAIYLHRADRLDLLRRETYSSSEHRCLAELLACFLEPGGEKLDAACLGVPAPVHAGVVYPLPNLPLRVERESVVRAAGTDRIALINDVEASAEGIRGLSTEDLVCLQVGHVDPAGNRAVVSVGTGFGVSALTPAGRTFATEAGHATFSPRSSTDFDLQSKLWLEHGHVSWERVASGSALPRIHALLAPAGSPRLEASEIVRRSDTDPVCREVADTCRRYIGAAAGNIALTLMATGGVYLTGGVASKIIDDRNADALLDAFCDKGRMRELLQRVPVFLARQNLALRGAARRAVELLAGEPVEA